MTLFWILWTFCGLMSLVPVYFFFVGLKDGSITARNIGLWAIILMVVAAVLGGSVWLKSHNELSLAKILLIIAAVPGILVLIYFLIVITSKTKWN
jgi:hypothetical protein